MSLPFSLIDIYDLQIFPILRKFINYVLIKGFILFFFFKRLVFWAEKNLAWREFMLKNKWNRLHYNLFYFIFQNDLRAEKKTLRDELNITLVCQDF